MEDPKSFITDRSQPRSTTRAWIFNTLACISVITAFSLTLSIVHDVSSLHCRLTTTDIIQIALTITSLVLILYTLLSTGPRSYLRVLPYHQLLHIAVMIILMALSGALIYKLKASCAELRTACAGNTSLKSLSLKGKECYFGGSTSPNRAVRSLISLSKRGSGGFSPNGAFIKNASSDEKGRFFAQIAAEVFLFINFVYAVAEWSRPRSTNQGEEEKADAGKGDDAGVRFTEG